MNLIALIESFERRVDQDKWSAFVAYADEFDAALEELAKLGQDDADLNRARRMMIDGQMLNTARSPFVRIVAAEFVSLLPQEYKHLEMAVEKLFAARENKTDYLIAASLAVNLLQPLQTPLAFRMVGPGNIIRRLFEPFLNNDPFFQHLVTPPNYSALLASFRGNLQNYRTVSGLLPGDCLFRRQAPSIYNPFRDFGHAGIYLGCDDPNADVNDCANHKVAHVVNDTPACQLVTLKEFCEPNNKKESFWGVYQVNLTQDERERVVNNALSSVGHFTYAFRGGYKGPTSYRCDGFIEFCYENAAISSPPMDYRGGLFENDNWKTLNPSALRNCLTRKVSNNLLCCTFEP